MSNWWLKFSQQQSIWVTILTLSSCWGGNTNLTQAQVVPDDTLGNEASVVNQISETLQQIEGGALRGENLFHSFLEFSINEGNAAYFANPAEVLNIFSRVTGNNISHILGKLGVLGDANLYFVNPNGILFGADAQLDIAGSFIASSGSGFILPNGVEYSVTNPQAPPLLTVNTNAPVGIRFEGSNGIITNAGDLVVASGQTLTLVGGDVSLDGGSLRAPGGRVELGGLSEAGTVTLNDDRTLSFPAGVGRADVSLTNGAKVEVAAGGGGNIVISARNIEVFGDSRLVAGIKEDLGSVGTQAGDLIINATGEIKVEQSRIQNDVMSKGTGNSGNIQIAAESLSLTEEAELTANTFGVGNAGNIFLRINGPVTIVNGSLILSEVGVAQKGKVRGRGNGGLIDIEAESFSLIDDGRTTVRTRADGDAGRIIIKVADAVSLVNGGRITSGVNSDAVGEGGDIEIRQARSLSTIDGGFLQSSTSGVGDAGNIIVNASDFVELSGTDQKEGNNQGRSSGLFASTEEAKPGDGGKIDVTTGRLQLSHGAVISVISNSDCLPCKGGKIVINANTLEVTSGGQLLSAALSQGDAGDITINASDQILISGSDRTFAERLTKFPERTSNIDPASGLFARTESSGAGKESRGKGGNITLQTPELLIENGGIIAVDSLGEGEGGNITITNQNLSLNQGTISAETTSGDGGNINLSVKEFLTLRNKSKISTTAGNQQTGGDGGDISIFARYIFAIPEENSDIIANAFTGKGGQIFIATEAIFGIEPRDELTFLSDITASSELGVDGIIEITRLNVDPLEGLTNLPEIRAEVQVAQGCDVGGEGSISFYDLGKGGLPAKPGDYLTIDSIITPWIRLTNEVNPQSWNLENHKLVKISDSETNIIFTFSCGND